MIKKIIPLYFCPSYPPLPLLTTLHLLLLAQLLQPHPVTFLLLQLFIASRQALGWCTQISLWVLGGDCRCNYHFRHHCTLAFNQLAIPCFSSFLFVFPDS